MSIKYYYDIVQHTDEWMAARCGLLTASEMHKIITPANMRLAANQTSRDYVASLLAQRITKFVEPTWFGGDMERGVLDEIEARELYRVHYSPLTECGFVTNDRYGFVLGYSPDGLVNDSDVPGQIEAKSRLQKFQIQTILDNEMPSDFLFQVQTGMIVTERKWCDFISYCGGLYMYVTRIWADEVVQKAILDCAAATEEVLAAKMRKWEERVSDKNIRLIPTERRQIEEDIVV